MYASLEIDLDSTRNNLSTRDQPKYWQNLAGVTDYETMNDTMSLASLILK